MWSFTTCAPGPSQPEAERQGQSRTTVPTTLAAVLRSRRLVAEIQRCVKWSRMVRCVCHEFLRYIVGCLLDPDYLVTEHGKDTVKLLQEHIGVRPSAEGEARVECL